MRSRLSYGFIEHGHLCGAAALLVTATSEDLVSVDDVLRAWRGGERIHIHVSGVGRRGALAAGWASTMADALRNNGVRRLSACVRPGVFLPSDTLAYESIMRVTAADFESFTAGDLDPRIGSASVHFWPGSGLLDILTNKLTAPFGLHLIVNHADIGPAKVWLSAVPQPRWKVAPFYPLNNLEAAEFDEMTTGTAT